MSEHITQTAVLDDCFHLMLLSNEICPDFHNVGYAYRESARLGAVTQADQAQIISLLENLRDRWSARKSEERLEQKLAFVLGWLCQQATTHQVQSLRQQLPNLTPEEEENPPESSVYQEIFLLREIYGNENQGPFNPQIFNPQAHPAAATVDVGELEQLVRLLLQRALIAQPPLAPTGTELEEWLQRVLTLREDFAVNLQRYAQVFVQPDPEKIQRYLTEINFYDENDPHIRVARAVQRRDELRASYVVQALQATSTSQYGQALKRGYDYLYATSDFFVRKIESAALRTRLEIS
jgi:hypothetical protein